MLDKLKRMLHWIHLVESGLLALLLIAMIGLSISDIVMRNLFNSGFALAPQLVRVLVLWLGLLGALYATRHNKHITVDVLARPLPARAKAVVNAITSLFACSVCSVVAWHSYLFVRDSWSYGDVIFDSIPAWVVQIIIPASFFLISTRFCLHAIGWVFIPGYMADDNKQVNIKAA